MGAIQSKRYKICWHCNGKDAALECSQCTRLFHRDCLTRGELFSKRNWICVVCTKLVENADREKDLKMLPTLTTRLMNEALFKGMLDNLKNALKDADESKFNAIDSILKAIELSKSDEIYKVYNSFDGFLVDIQWILNNYSKILEDDDEKRKSAQLLQIVIDEIDGLKKCGECYFNANFYPETWFTMVCDEPHIIAWVKFQGCNYWPVKVMAVNGRKLSVRFFGDHTHADVSAAKCLLYSSECPGKAARSRGNSFKMAINEVNLYIENIRLKFGSFNYARVNTEFDSMLISKYISDMIPRSVQSKRRSSESCQMDRPISTHSQLIRAKSVSSPLNDFEHPSNIPAEVPSPIDLISSEDAADVDSSESTSDGISVETNFILPVKKVRFMDDVKPELEPNQTSDFGKNVQTNGCDTKQSANVIKSDSSSAKEITHPIGNLSESDSDLYVANAKMKQEVEKLTEQNTDLSEKLKERDHDIYQLEIEKKLLITEIKRLEKRNSKTIEEAQTLQICCGCGDSKPRDTFYFCNIRCRKDYWEQHEK